MPQHADLTSIRNLLQTGRHAEAERQLQAICAGPAADAESWFFLGALAGMRGDAVSAERCFREALVLKPDFLQARFNLGIAFRDQGRPDEARAEIEAVVAIEPGHAEACNVLGCLYADLDRLDEAERCFRSALMRIPAFPDALANLGNVLCSRQRWEEAIGFYRRALEIAPSHGVAVLNLGNALVSHGGALMKLGRVDEAMASLKQAIAMNPAHAEAHALLGGVFRQIGKIYEAEQAYREAIRIRPDYQEVHYFLATLGSGLHPQIAPAEYVIRTFDEYAETFDAELVGKLQYRIPEILLDAVQTVLEGRKDLVVIDLGCGTGLCGPLFRPLARLLTGVDLSSKMVAKARLLAVYDELEVGELSAALLKREHAIDLAMAADVFIYVGELASVFEAAAKALKSGGVFAFSVESEKGEEEGQGYVLRTTGRYAHSQAYIVELAHRYSFELVLQKGVDVRLENGHPVLGDVYVLVKN